MFIHPVDTLSDFSFTAGGASGAAPSVAAAQATPQPIGSSLAGSSGWRVTRVAGIDGLCFARRGSGGWNGLITVCQGQVATLGSLPRPTLTPAVLRRIRSEPPVSSPIDGDAFRTHDERVFEHVSTPLSSVTARALQQLAAGVLLFLGIALALKSGAMLLEDGRRYG